MPFRPRNRSSLTKWWVKLSHCLSATLGLFFIKPLFVGIHVYVEMQCASENDATYRHIKWCRMPLPIPRGTNIAYIRVYQSQRLILMRLDKSVGTRALFLLFFLKKKIFSSVPSSSAAGLTEVWEKLKLNKGYCHSGTDTELYHKPTCTTVLSPYTLTTSRAQTHISLFPTHTHTLTHRGVRPIGTLSSFNDFNVKVKTVHKQESL